MRKGIPFISVITFLLLFSSFSFASYSRVDQKDELAKRKGPPEKNILFNKVMYGCEEKQSNKKVSGEHYCAAVLYPSKHNYCYPPYTATIHGKITSLYKSNGYDFAKVTFKESSNKANSENVLIPADVSKEKKKYSIKMGTTVLAATACHKKIAGYVFVMYGVVEPK